MVIQFEGFDEQIHICDKETDIHKAPIEDLFLPSFMHRYTDVDTFYEFMEHSPWDIGSMQEFGTLLAEVG